MKNQDLNLLLLVFNGFATLLIARKGEFLNLPTFPLSQLI